MPFFQELCYFKVFLGKTSPIVPFFKDSRRCPKKSRLQSGDSHFRSPTNKPVWANYSTDQKHFTGHMSNIKLVEKSHKMSFNALPVKIQQSKNRDRREYNVPPIPGQLGLDTKLKKTFGIKDDTA